MFFPPKLERIADISDLQKVARARVPKMFYQYADSGSYSEGTYQRNEQAFKNILFKQRVAVDMSNRTLATTMLGEPVHMPVALAPVGSCGLQHADGEIKAAQVCEELGIPFTLSTVSICSLEDIAAHTSKPFWFQLYVIKDREFIRDLIDRAKKAKVSALVITLDLQIPGQRHKDVRNGLVASPKPTLNNWLDLMTKPYWGLHMLGTKRHTFGNIVGHAKGVQSLNDVGAWSVGNFDQCLDWDDIKELMDYWGGKVILKGIMEVADALKAVEVGADAIVVSNHGGRQLDGAPATIDVLPAIVEAVGDKLEVFLDGGIRCGQDVLRAYALGAKGVFIGRPYVYGLGAYGKAGVRKALDIIYRELDTTMAFCGHTKLTEVTKAILQPGTYPLPDKYADKE